MMEYLNDYWMGGGGVVPKAKSTEGRRQAGSSYRDPGQGWLQWDLAQGRETEAKGLHLMILMNS